MESLSTKLLSHKTIIFLIGDSFRNLSSSVSEIEALRLKMKQWPPLRSGEEKYEHGLADVLAEEMGWQID